MSALGVVGKTLPRIMKAISTRTASYVPGTRAFATATRTQAGKEALDSLKAIPKMARTAEQQRLIKILSRRPQAFGTVAREAATTARARPGVFMHNGRPVGDRLKIDNRLRTPRAYMTKDGQVEIRMSEKTFADLKANRPLTIEMDQSMKNSKGVVDKLPGFTYGEAQSLRTLQMQVNPDARFLVQGSARSKVYVPELQAIDDPTRSVATKRAIESVLGGVGLAPAGLAVGGGVAGLGVAYKDALTGEDKQRKLDEYLLQRKEDVLGRAMANRVQRDVAFNMQVVAQQAPDLYNQVMAGRRLPQGAVPIGGGQRVDLMEMLAATMSDPSFQEYPAESELAMFAGMR